MSYISFDALEGSSVEVGGWERAWMGCLCNDITCGILRPLADDLWEDRPREALRALVACSHPWWEGDRGDRALSGLHTFVSVSGMTGGAKEGFLLPRGDSTDIADTFDVAINTVLAIGSDELRLCAVLHAQCELHCYVLGPNRKWLADLIDRALRLGVLRENGNWEDAATLLRASRDGPVVCSYSVCDGFPRAEDAARVAGWKGEATDEGELEELRYEWFDGLPTGKGFRLAFQALREDDERCRMGLEMKPDNWSERRFGSGATAFHVLEEFYRLQKT